MILVADSGSTKTDWRLAGKQGMAKAVRTIGLNPFHKKFEEIKNLIREDLLPQTKGSNVNQIYFYGAGCASEDSCLVLSKALRVSFPNAAIEVNSDLLGAARALCNRQAGIACILGTGSNSCYFDGEKIKHSIPPLGYILGDEGSGTYMGKKLLTDYLRNEMPEELAGKLCSEPGMSKMIILEKIYKENTPARYLAGFALFIHENRNDPYMHRLVYNSFSAFVEKIIKKYERFNQMKIHFVGGIAYSFSDILREVVAESGLYIGNILKNPIESLTGFHLHS